MPFLPPNCMVHDCLFIYIYIYILQLATISGGRSPIHHLGTRLVACSKASAAGNKENNFKVASKQKPTKYIITVTSVL